MFVKNIIKPFKCLSPTFFDLPQAPYFIFNSSTNLLYIFRKILYVRAIKININNAAKAAIICIVLLTICLLLSTSPCPYYIIIPNPVKFNISKITNPVYTIL